MDVLAGFSLDEQACPQIDCLGDHQRPCSLGRSVWVLALVWVYWNTFVGNGMLGELSVAHRLFFVLSRSRQASYQMTQPFGHFDVEVNFEDYETQAGSFVLLCLAAFVVKLVLVYIEVANGFHPSRAWSSSVVWHKIGSILSDCDYWKSSLTMS